MESEGLTALTMEEVKEFERNFQEQGYHPFHRKQPDGTWKVYKGKWGKK
jgi:hypothetical protein